MPQYHFHVTGNKPDRDDDGIELPDLRAAKCAAVRFAGEMLRDADHDAIWSSEWFLNVTDERDLVLLTIHVVGMEAAAIQRSPKAPG